MDEKYLALLKRVEALEKKQINVSMTNNDDVNAYRAVQRALQTRNLTIGGSNNTDKQMDAILTLNSRNRAFLPPRTNDIALVQVPVEGMMMYDYDREGLMVHNGNTWGMTAPRYTTTQRDAIPAPLGGMIIYNMTTDKLNMYSDATASWQAVTSV